jgi:hypothetical protein
MTVKLLTFKTNHTIMGDVVIKTNGDYEISQPVQVVMQPAKEGMSIGFVPFLQFCDEFKTGIKLVKDDILCVTQPVVDLENQYNDLFGSGIQIASTIPKM